MNKNTLRDVKFSKLAPLFVQKLFAKNYTNPKNENRIRKVYANLIWDKPVACVNEDLNSDGPSGIGGIEKQEFMKSIFQLIYDKSRLDLDPIVTVSRSLQIYHYFLSFSAFLKDFEKFKEISDWIGKKLSTAAMPEDDEEASSFLQSLTNIFIVACRNFQPEHFQELYYAMKLVYMRTPMSVAFLVQFLTPEDREGNLKLISKLLAIDSIFWKSASFNFDQLKLIIRELEKENPLSKEKLLEPISDQKLNEFIGKFENSISTRLCQLQLMELTPNFENVLRVAKFVVSNLQQASSEIEQGKKICRFLLDQAFKRNRKKLEINRKPSKDDESFRSICNCFFDPSIIALEIKMNQQEISLYCKFYASPELFREQLDQFKNHTLELLKMIDFFIPSTPFPVQPEARFRKQWNKWLGDLDDSEIRFPLQDRTNLSFLNGIQLDQFSRFFEFSFPTPNVMQIRKKWLSYLKLKREFTNENNNNSNNGVEVVVISDDEIEAQRKTKKQKNQ